MSRKIFEDSDSYSKNNYTIQGPMGKGLGLTPNSRGTHIAFIAGTAVCAFIDLVARILLESLNIIDEK